jgi:hypothetical protein
LLNKEICFIQINKKKGKEEEDKGRKRNKAENK